VLPRHLSIPVIKDLPPTRVQQDGYDSGEVRKGNYQ